MRKMTAIILVTLALTGAFSQNMTELSVRAATGLEKMLELAAPANLKSIETSSGLSFFVNLPSLVNWPLQTRLKPYHAAIVDPRSYTESRFPNPFFERLVLAGQNDQVIFFVFLKDAAAGLSAADVFAQAEDFYANNFLFAYAKVIGENRTRTPIDRIQMIVAVPSGDSHRYLFRGYESVAYRVGDEICGYGKLGESSVRLSGLGSMKLGEYANLDLPGLAAAAKSAAESKRLESFISGSRKQLDWYNEFFRKRYATTREVMMTLATEDELKALDQSSVAYYLNHWSYGLSAQFPALSADERSEAFSRIKEAVIASLGAPYSIDALNLSDNDKDPAIKYAIYGLLSDFGETWAFLRENRTPTLLPEDISLALASPLDQSSRSFLASLDPAKIHLLSATDRCRLIELLSISLKLDELAAKNPDAYERVFKVMEPFILMKKSILKSKLPSGASTDYGYAIQPLNSAEQANYLQLVLDHFPKRVARIVLSLPESMIDPSVMPLGAKKVW